MAGRGRAPKPPGERRNATPPARGEWRATPGIGWQHGPIPEPPSGLLPASVDAWTTWMRSWFAAYWIPGDLPGLHVMVKLLDLVERGNATRAPELRLWLDTYGASPKGQQDRRWVAPTAERPTAANVPEPTGRYGHLRAVESGS